MEWEAADRVQKNGAGEYRALIGGEWVPVSKAQKNAEGKFRVMRGTTETTADAGSESMLDAALKGAGNLAAGAVRGAGSIGATILAPYDMAKDAIAGKGLSLESNRQRRADIDAGLQSIGADTDSLMYQGGKLAGEIAGTAGAGGVIANGARAIPVLAKFAPVIESGGFGLGGAATGNAATNTALRAAGGAIQGGAQAAMVDPEMAAKGAAIGAVVPSAIKTAGAVGTAIGNKTEAMARALMQSALKPTIKQLRTGQADRAITTMLDEGINASMAGVEKMRGRVSDINSQIGNDIAGSNAVIDPQRVAQALNDVRQRFGQQVSPSADIAAIDSIGTDFLGGPGAGALPVQLAQKLKQGTYRVLSGKYGEQGSAATEAQKALARGLKNEIAQAVPSIAPLNARESALLDAIAVAERRAMIEGNKNPGGLALLSPSPAALAAFLADRSGALKSVAAMGLHAAANAAPVPRGLPNLVEQYGLLGAPSVIATSP